MFSNFVSNKPKRASLDDNAAGLIAHFEHSYDARLIATKPEVRIHYGVEVFVLFWTIYVTFTSILPLPSFSRPICIASTLF